MQFLASAPRGLADLLARELVAFGAENVKERSTGVAFSGTLRTAYRACLESRIANRVFLELARFDAANTDAFYTAVRTIDWTAHLAPGATLACDFTGRHEAITHTHFGALKLKDAIVDSVRDRTGSRPDVALDRPSVRVHAHAHGNNITVSLDLSGESLHRRGYRSEAGEAPLKENVAAGILMRSGWTEMAPTGAQFLDPMCGSGTFVIEAAMVAANIAPGLKRDYYGFLGWRGHDAQLWRDMLEGARGAAAAGIARMSDALTRAAADEDARLQADAREHADADADAREGEGEGADANANASADAGPSAGARGGADASAEHGAGSGPAFRGYDRDATAVRVARANADRAGVGRFVQFEVRALVDAASFTAARAPISVVSSSLPAAAIGSDSEVGSSAAARSESAVGSRVAAGSNAVVGSESAAGSRAVAGSASAGVASADAPASASESAPRGLLAVNPPYGVRLEDHAAALVTHRELGKVLRERFQGWVAAVLIGAPELGMELGIRAYRTHTVWNGALECRLLRLKVDAQSEREPGRFGKPGTSIRESPGARMFANRLAKNLKRLQSWATREGISCYRVYDADMPEYAFAIDIYATLEPDQKWLYVQEYAAPSEIELDAIRRRRHEALSVLTEVTGVPKEQIHVRVRRRTKGSDQYRKVDEQAHFHRVIEGGLKFRVNFDDYLDTGLFLDHRITRSRLRDAARDKRFLNLFAYTGTATVYAAAGGATSSTTVDMSRTYLDWAQRNLSINNLIGQQHALVQADCREWLQESAHGKDRYDLIFLDPPTFSNSKRMEGVLDVERDHPSLIDACIKLLAPGGLLVFSTNAQKFKLDEGLTARYQVRDISAATLPKDFERNPRIHKCFEIRHRAS